MEARPKFSRLLKSVGKLPDIPSKPKRRGRFGRSMSQLSAPVKMAYPMAYPTDGLSGQLTIQPVGSSTAKSTGALEYPIFYSSRVPSARTKLTNNRLAGAMLGWVRSGFSHALRKRIAGNQS
jgi:hypothetical protein